MSAKSLQRTRYVAPPGQDAVLVRMFNPADLAARGWEFARASITESAVHGFYRGSRGEVARITLAHPESAPTTWRRIEHFAVSLRIEPAQASPTALLEAVLGAVRAAGGDFVWRQVGDDSAALDPNRQEHGGTSGESEAQRAREAEADIDLHLEHTPFIDLGFEFDHAAVLAEALALKDRFVAYQSDPAYGISGWRGLALQALDGDAARAATTEVDEAVLTDDSRYRLTDVAALCPIGMAFLESVLDLQRCRTIAFLMLEPGARITVHVDGSGPPVMRSVNIAVNMPPGCTLTIDCNADGSDHAYTQRAPFRDGTGLLMNVAKFHYAVNDSPQPRIHIVSRGSLRMAPARVLALAEQQHGIRGRDALLAAIAEKRRELGTTPDPAGVS